MRPFSRRLAWLAYMTVCFSLMFVPVANAYIDPGAGSMVFQAVIALGLASAVAVRSQWQRIRSLFTRRSPKE